MPKTTVPINVTTQSEGEDADRQIVSDAETSSEEEELEELEEELIIEDFTIDGICGVY